jgi:hypothetical protein
MKPSSGRLEPVDVTVLAVVLVATSSFEAGLITERESRLLAEEAVT